MKNTRRKIYLLMIMMVISFYSFVPVNAMAADQIEEPAAEAVQATDTEAQAAQAAEMDSEAEAAQATETDGEAEAAQAAETDGEAEAAQAVDTEAEAGQTAKSAADAYSGQTVSTGCALIEWLEAHRNIGGTVKLADNVTLEGIYSFCPDGPDMPAVFVDTDIYTITVTGTVELMSDSHLTFFGQPEGRGVFYVAPGGMLSMAGVAVQSGRCALWQEEGAGLAAEDCQISGDVHYADTPFVVDMESPCIIVEKEQTLREVLPEQIACTVNRQGKIGSYEQVFLTWNQEGTERQQEERRRFQMQGSFLHVVSAKPPRCTVVYNDYPLTFTDVRAFAQGDAYMFQGWYTRPAEAGTITVMSQYSLDGENWISCEETTEDSFFIIVPAKACGTYARSDIYIRLKWEDNGILYFSNLLRYSANDLDDVQDIGGSRGGGTSIVNLPGKPHKNTGDTTSEDEKSTSGGTGGTDSDNVDGGNAGTAGDGQASYTEPGAAGNGQSVEPQPAATEAAGGQPAGVEPKTTDGEQPAEAKPETSEGGQPAETEPEELSGRQPLEEEPETVSTEQPADTELKSDNTVGNSPTGNESADSGEAYLRIKEQTSREEVRPGRRIAVAAAFVLLSAITGTAGFYVRSRQGTKR